MLHKDKKKGKLITNATVSADVRDYGSDPYFVQKAEASKKVIEKYGLPKSWLKEKK
jgi:hypothetical protein